MVSCVVLNGSCIRSSSRVRLPFVAWVASLPVALSLMAREKSGSRPRAMISRMAAAIRASIIEKPGAPRRTGAG